MSTLSAKISSLVKSLRLAPDADLIQMLSDVDSAIDSAAAAAVAEAAANIVDGMLLNGANSRLGVARFTFDAGVEANRTIGAHNTGVTVPNNAIIVGGFVDVNTAFTSDATNAGTIAISVQAANDIISAAAVSGAPYSTIGRKAIVPKANTPESTSVKTDNTKPIVCTVAVEALLTGKLTGFLYYVVGVASA